MSKDINQISVSIIVPIYNVELYMEQCLVSVQNQSYEGPIECLLIDDCGQDKSIEITERFTENYHGPIQFKIIHHDHNSGLSAARNTGLKAAVGEYVYFLDSDDEIIPDCISLLTQPLEKECFDIVTGDFKTIGGDDNHERYRFHENKGIYGNDIIRSFKEGQWPMMAWNKLCRRDFLIKENLYFREGIIHEDELWSFEIACLANSFFKVSKQTYLYKIRGGSITTANKAKRRGECLGIVFSEMYTFAKQHNLLNNKDVHNKIENFRISSLRILNDYGDIAKVEYFKQRKNAKVSWIDCFKLNGSDLRKQLRDAHLLMSPKVGFLYIKQMVSLIK